MTFLDIYWEYIMFVSVILFNIAKGDDEWEIEIVSEQRKMFS